MRVFVLALLAACGVPHMDPRPRDNHAQGDSVVEVRSYCGDFEGRSSRATGVMISEDRVLTAAHAVGCGDIPYVHVTTLYGRTLRMVVERDDRVFGGGTDVARLTVWGMETFDLAVRPPELAEHYEGPVIVRFIDEEDNGMLYGNTVRGIIPVKGDSGSPVYDPAGRLVGIMLTSDGGIQRIGDYWLEGT